MLARRSTHRASFVAARALAALLVLGTAIGCASMRSAAGVPPRATIAFENTTNEPVRVYLIEEGGGHYLLGNVPAMERHHLRIPIHMGLTEARRVSLAAVPMSRGMYGPVQSSEHMNSPTVDSVLEIATMRWVMTPNALHSERGGTVSVVR